MIKRHKQCIWLTGSAFDLLKESIWERFSPKSKFQTGNSWGIFHVIKVGSKAQLRCSFSCFIMFSADTGFYKHSNSNQQVILWKVLLYRPSKKKTLLQTELISLSLSKKNECTYFSIAETHLWSHLSMMFPLDKLQRCKLQYSGPLARGQSIQLMYFNLSLYQIRPYRQSKPIQYVN